MEKTNTDRWNDEPKRNHQKHGGIKKLIIQASCIMLIVSGTVVVTKTSPLEHAKAKMTTLFQQDPKKVLEEELRIHAGKAVTEDGHYVNPYLDHDCALGPSIEPNDFALRFIQYCEEHQIEEADIQLLMAKEPELFPKEKDPFSDKKTFADNHWDLSEEKERFK